MDAHSGVTRHCPCRPQTAEARVPRGLFSGHLVPHLLLLAQCEHRVIDGRGQLLLGVVLVLIDYLYCIVYFFGPPSSGAAGHDFIQDALPAMPASAVTAQCVPMCTSLMSQAVHHLLADFRELVAVGGVP